MITAFMTQEEAFESFLQDEVKAGEKRGRKEGEKKKWTKKKKKNHDRTFANQSAVVFYNYFKSSTKQGWILLNISFNTRGAPATICPTFK